MQRELGEKATLIHLSFPSSSLFSVHRRVEKENKSLSSFSSSLRDTSNGLTRKNIERYCTSTGGGNAGINGY